MINSNELRIGNWVYPNIKYPKVITGVITGGVYIKNFERCSVSDISGIPLTPEILQKCGAVNRSGCTYFIGKAKFTYENNELSQFVRFHWSGKITYIQYLHQLQNLFFSLVGQELQIKL